jgi:MYXO-CTERM domain-containing protein
VTGPAGTFVGATTYAGYLTPGATCGDGGIYERADHTIDWIDQAAARTLPRVAGPTADPAMLALGEDERASAAIAANDPIAAAQHTFEIAAPPARGSATVDGAGVVTFVSTGGQGADRVVVAVHDAAAPARTTTVAIDVAIGPGGCGCGSGGGATGALIPAAIALVALRRRRNPG